LGQEAEYLWHQDGPDLSRRYDCVVLPGGFSYGDYLRPGAIARFSPVMAAVERFAAEGGLVIGICNGFQVLLEAGLLPGGMRRNRDLKFICEHVHLRVEASDTVFTRNAAGGRVLRIPIAHGDGNYYADPATLRALADNRQVVFRYTAPDGTRDERWNVNGSTDAIAGICNRERNVVGLMPHPERACEAAVGSTDGRVVFESVLAVLACPPVAEMS
jgi:phosphoribosylformylglycinamidine synthase